MSNNKINANFETIKIYISKFRANQLSYIFWADEINIIFLFVKIMPAEQLLTL